MRVVLDPNVIVSGLISSGTTAAVLDAWLDRRAFDPIVCPMLLGELEEVLLRPKFEFIERPTITGLLERLRAEGECIDDPVVQSGVTADPDDDYLVALARHSGADYLVSGDPDLAGLDIPDLEVVTPAQFLACIESM